MATIDPNIALGVKPLQLDNPLNAFAQASQIQHYQRQNELANRAIEKEDAINRAYASAYNQDTGEIDVNKLRSGAASSGVGSALPGIEKTIMEGRELKAKVNKSEFENKQAQYNQSITDILRFDDRDQILGALQQKVDTKELTSQQAQQLASTVPQDPRMIPAWQVKTARGILSAKDQLERHFTSQDFGGGTRVISTPKFGGGPAQVVQGSQIAKTMTPGESARLTAESAVGTLTPQSLDVAANVYLQTGQLPTGLGKAAAGLRTQVMNRATELSTGKAPADVAGGIVDAKLDVASRGKAVKDFSTGIQGRQVNAFNTAIDHLGTMDKLTDALSNGDLKAINSIGNVIARQTGQPAPTNFDAAKQIVTAEVIKAVVASGGGVTERQEAERNFAAANSPEQLKGIIGTYKQLLGGQLNSLGLQYENTTGRKDFDKKLTGDAKAELQKLRGGEQKTAPAGGVDTKNPLLN